MNWNEAIDGFIDCPVLIIGDVMIDAYYWGDVHRISPEAPVPVISISKTEKRLGGAANVALNISALKAIPTICGIIADDENGTAFKNILIENDLNTDGLFIEKGGITTTKSRVISSGQHMIRIDEEDCSYIDKTTEAAFVTHVKTLLDKNDYKLIIFEDYNKGALTKTVIESIIEVANDKGIVTAVDPKKENFDAYKNCALYKPNFKEIQEGLNLDIDKQNDASLFSAAQKMESVLKNKISLITLSERGVLIHAEGNGEIIPAHPRKIIDVSGAGDTVISVAGLALATGLSLNNCAALANLAGGLVCEKVGVVPIDLDILKTEANKL